MVFEGKTASSRLVTTALSAKEKIVQTCLTIIIPYMIGMRFRTSAFLTRHVKTERLPALLAEFKKGGVQGLPADLTITNLHTFQVIG
jgi:hypothetical protein